MSFDPGALRALGGGPRRSNRPVTAAFLVRVGVSAAVGAAVTNVIILLVARTRNWSTAPPEGPPVRPLSVILVCLLVGVLAALGAYVASRVTKHPVTWVVLSGIAVLVASIQALPVTLQVMHVVAGAWIIGWLARAVRGGSHLAETGA